MVGVTSVRKRVTSFSLSDRCLRLLAVAALSIERSRSWLVERAIEEKCAREILKANKAGRFLDPEAVSLALEVAAEHAARGSVD